MCFWKGSVKFSSAAGLLGNKFWKKDFNFFYLIWLCLYRIPCMWTHPVTMKEEDRIAKQEGRDNLNPWNIVGSLNLSYPELPTFSLLVIWDNVFPWIYFIEFHVSLNKKYSKWRIVEVKAKKNWFYWDHITYQIFICIIWFNFYNNPVRLYLIPSYRRVWLKSLHSPPWN